MLAVSSLPVPGAEQGQQWGSHGKPWCSPQQTVAQDLFSIRRAPGAQTALIKVPLHNSPDGDKSPQRLLLKADT